MSDAILLDLLTPGAVYISESAKNPQAYTVLFRTNQDIKTKSGAPSRHVDSVVFFDSKGRLRSIPTDEFTSRFRFHHVDGLIEQRVEALFAEEESDSEVEKTDEETFDQIIGEVEKTEQDNSLNLSDDMPITYFSAKNTDDELATLERLAFATVSYNQRPDMSQSVLTHELVIEATDIGFENIENLFRMSNENGISAFQIAGHPIVQWDIAYGVYHTYSGSTHYATVIVGVSMQVAQEEVPEQSTTVEAAPAVDPSLVPADAVAEMAALDPQTPQTAV